MYDCHNFRFKRLERDRKMRLFSTMDIEIDCIWQNDKVIKQDLIYDNSLTLIVDVTKRRAEKSQE